MKKSEFYKIEEDQIYFVQSGNRFAVKDIKRIEAVTRTVLKNTLHTVLNAVANAAVSSIGNGDEKVNVFVRIEFDGHDELIKLNDEIMVKGNLDYYKVLEHAHNLRDALKRDRNRIKEGL